MNNNHNPPTDLEKGFISRWNDIFNQYLHRKGWVKNTQVKNYPLIFVVYTFVAAYIGRSIYNWNSVYKARKGGKSSK